MTGQEGTTINNDERQTRIKKLRALQQLGINPYPTLVSRSHTIAMAYASTLDSIVEIVGRLRARREMGKLTFCHLADESGQIQIVFNEKQFGKEQYQLFLNYIDIGDIVGIKGTRFCTRAGEESILVSDWTLLAKSLLPLPDKFHGLHNEELRYRKRYLDFLFNPENKAKIIVRSKVLKYLRQFLDGKGFTEVETPMLEIVASGALAKSFETHINAFDLDIHLRIAGGELWHKQLLVGGFEKVYEIGRVFRNEGVDREHNPEFTMLEYYWAYANHMDNMRLHEEMIPFILEQSIGTQTIEYEGHTISFVPPYPSITFREAILQHSDIDINNFDAVEDLRKSMKDKGFEVEEQAERGKLLDSLFKQSARPKIIQPTFVTEYPVELKPLTKRAADPRYTAMFQLVISGFELTNNYTELNDPIDQRERLLEQMKMKEAGEDEYMAIDTNFIEALEHGLPPTTGTGIGIDRFVALITGSHTLREVMTFPLMKPEV